MKGYFETIFRLDTELWDFESTKTEIINPTLPSSDYAYGFGLFAVEAGFCRDPNSTTTNVYTTTNAYTTTTVYTTTHVYTTTNGFTANVYKNCIILFSVMLITGSL